MNAAPTAADEVSSDRRKASAQAESRLPDEFYTLAELGQAPDEASAAAVIIRNALIGAAIWLLAATLIFLLV